LLFVFAYCAAASFCIKSIPCASCVDMLTHVAFGGRAASCPEGHRSGIGKEGLVGQWTRWTKRCCPKWCQNLSQTLPRPKKSLQSLDHVGPIPKDHALHAALLIFASQCHTVTARRYHGHVRHDRASIPDLQTLGCCICCLAQIYMSHR
jgi:hypothetical protein